MPKETQPVEAPPETLPEAPKTPKLDFSKAPQPIGKVLDEINPQGQAVKAKDILGWELVIHAIKPFKGLAGTAYHVIFTDAEGGLYNTILGGTVVKDKLATVKEHLPVSCKLTQVEGGEFGRYYDLV